MNRFKLTLALGFLTWVAFSYWFMHEVLTVVLVASVAR
jgi:hypothetical protein